MSKIRKRRKLEKGGNWKKQELRRSRKSEKVGNQKKQEIRKSRKLKKERNPKKRIPEKLGNQNKRIKNQLIKESTNKKQLQSTQSWFGPLVLF